MIKVVIERHTREGQNLAPMLRELRTAAMKMPGYISGETLVSTEDESLVITISTWRSLDDWKAWEASETRNELYRLVATLLVEEPEIRTYQIMATEPRTA